MSPINIKEVLEGLCLLSREYSPKDCHGNEILMNYTLENSGWKCDRRLVSYSQFLDVDLEEIAVEGSLKKEGSSYVILDLGCGNGVVKQQMDSLNDNIVSFGITNVLFENMYNRDRVLLGDLTPASSLPYVLPMIPDESVDLVLSVQTMMHISNEYYTGMASEIARILSKDGVALLDFFKCANDNKFSGKLFNSLQLSSDFYISNIYVGCNLETVRFGRGYFPS